MVIKKPKIVSFSGNPLKNVYSYNGWKVCMGMRKRSEPRTQGDFFSSKVLQITVNSKEHHSGLATISLCCK